MNCWSDEKIISTSCILKMILVWFLRLTWVKIHKVGFFFIIENVFKMLTLWMLAYICRLQREWQLLDVFDGREQRRDSRHQCQAARLSDHCPLITDQSSFNIQHKPSDCQKNLHRFSLLIISGKFCFAWDEVCKDIL